MDRAEFRRLAYLRVREARILLDNRQYSGAYYLGGYAVECALKACIARRTRLYEFPDRGFVNASYTHNLATLLRLAGLEPLLDREMVIDAQLSKYWAVVKDWSEESRYRRIPKVEADGLFEGIADPDHGVLRWLAQHW